MPEIEIKGIKLELDDNGFLKESDKWTSDVAKALSIQQGVEWLTEDHWRLINFIREYYTEFNVPPMIKKMSKATGFNLKHIYDLFPWGPIDGAIRIAGLPKPTGCI